MVKKIITFGVMFACLSSASIAATNKTDVENAREKVCTQTSIMGNMIMQLRQYKPEVSEKELLSELNDKFEKKEKNGLKTEEKERLTALIGKAYDKKLGKNDKEKKTAISLFQIETYDYCINNFK